MPGVPSRSLARRDCTLASSSSAEVDAMQVDGGGERWADGFFGELPPLTLYVR